MRLRSLLFVPGDRPDRMEKALGSGADALILDLEDSVAGAAKPEARRAVAAFLAANPSANLWVRINPLDTAEADRDLDSVLGGRPDGIVLPKSEGGASVSELARSLCLFGAAAAGVRAIETVDPAFRDPDGLAAYAARGRRDGFTGMMAIHPAQISVINQAFTPSEAEIEHARAVVDAFAASPGAGALSLDGKMIDRPHLLQAQRIMSAAG